MDLRHRIRYDEKRGTLFLNLRQLEVRSEQTIAAISSRVREICEPIRQRVHAVIDYDGFVLAADCEESYVRAIEELAERYWLGTTIFTERGFIRTRPGAASLPLHLVE